MGKSFSSFTVLLYRLLSYPYPYRVALFRLLMSRMPHYRPHYLACLYDAARLASVLGVPEISAAEFGVAGGNGLLALEKYAKEVHASTGVRIATFGFDMGGNAGLPPSTDPRDILYIWQPGDYKMDEAALRARLSGSTLYLGNVAETVGQFAKAGHPPLGACFFDLDYYTSTAAALKVFAEAPCLPRVTCYFDDVDVSSPFNGVLGAIADFNAGAGSRKIFRMAGHFHEQTFGMLSPRIMHMHDFAHAAYNTYVPGVTATELPLQKSA